MTFLSTQAAMKTIFSAALSWMYAYCYILKQKKTNSGFSAIELCFVISGLNNKVITPHIYVECPLILATFKVIYHRVTLRIYLD